MMKTHSPAGTSGAADGGTIRGEAYRLCPPEFISNGYWIVDFAVAMPDERLIALPANAIRRGICYRSSIAMFFHPVIDVPP